MKKRSMAAVAAAAAIALAVMTSTPAFAVTHSGHINCTGSPYTPRLTINASSSGSGSWVNYNSPNQGTVIMFPGGFSQRYAPYIRANWAIAATSFYSTPTGTCA